MADEPRAASIEHSKRIAGHLPAMSSCSGVAAPYGQDVSGDVAVHKNFISDFYKSLDERNSHDKAHGFYMIKL